VCQHTSSGIIKGYTDAAVVIVVVVVVRILPEAFPPHLDATGENAMAMSEREREREKL
jgi:hypothetical protein